MFLLNSAAFSEGRIRFAAFTQSAFDDSADGVETFRFTARALGPSGAAEVSARLDVVGSAGGARIHAGAGIAAQVGGGCETQMWGDANDDGFVDIADAQQLARHGVALSVNNPGAVADRGDVTNDGIINITDAQQIARFGVGLSAAPRVNTPIC
jgi:hypothetical protein